MPLQHFRFPDLYAFLRRDDLPQEAIDELGGHDSIMSNYVPDLDNVTDEHPWSMIEHYATSMNETVLEHFGNIADFYYLTDDRLDVIGVSVDPEKIPAIVEFASHILDIYDEDTDEARAEWERWDLGGDDDVDYNGSYLLILCDLISAYVKYNERTN